MLQRLRFATFLMSAFLLILAAPSLGQKKDTLKIQAIPHQLKWENEPKAYFIGKIDDWNKQTPEDIQKWQEKLANNKGRLLIDCKPIKYKR